MLVLDLLQERTDEIRPFRINTLSRNPRFSDHFYFSMKSLSDNSLQL